MVQTFMVVQCYSDSCKTFQVHQVLNHMMLHRKLYGLLISLYIGKEDKQMGVQNMHPETVSAEG